MTERLVVVGGDAAGMSAASQARRRRGPDDLAITVFERGHHTSYSACGIPYWIGGTVGGGVAEGVDALVVRAPEVFRTKQATTVHLRHEVVALDLDRREVVARDLDGGSEVREPYDQLVLATGARPVRPAWPGADAPGVHGVQTLDDGEAVLATLERGARRAVVVGGGYIGVEMAEAMVERGLEVTLVERDPEPMSNLDPDMGRLVRDAMVGMDIAVRTGETVEAVETGPDGRVTGVRTDAGVLPADLVVLGLGVRPESTLARAAGLPVGPTGGVVTDLRMRVPGHEGVWAAGDCVQSVHRVTGLPVHVALGTHAAKQGRIVGMNIGGDYGTFPGVVGTAVSKVCNLEIGRTGLKEGEVERAGLSCVSATITSDNRAGYFPGAEEMTVKLLAERRSGRLLGGQIVGRAASAKRIDTVAVALWQGMTVEEMTGLDLGYAPPFSPVWDPVLVAARKVVDAVEADLRARA